MQNKHVMLHTRLGCLVCTLLLLLQLACNKAWISPKLPSTDGSNDVLSSTKNLPWGKLNLSPKQSKFLQVTSLVSVLTLGFGPELYARIPQEILYGSSPPPITQRHSAENVLVIFPGAGGPDQNTARLKDKIVASDRKKGVQRYVEVYDWSPWRGNILRASFDSESVGRKVCSALAKDEKKEGKIQHLQAVGVSVGAFAADACVQAYKEQSTNPAVTRVTFLDPFTGKGIYGFGYGLKNFGKDADIAENYLNRDDEVPTTNDPLDLAFTFDITNAEAKKNFQPAPGDSFHSWPVAYLAEFWQTRSDQNGKIVEPTLECEPRGKVVEVP